MSGDDNPDDGRNQIPPWLRDELLEEASYRCAFCGPDAKKNGVPLEIHHQVPVCEGGATVKENLTVICRFCHRNHHSMVRPEDLDTDFGDVDPTGVDVKIVHALEEYGAMRQCDIKRVTNVSDHFRERLRELKGEGIVARSEEYKWDLSERVDNPYQLEFYEDLGDSLQYSRDALFRDLWNSGLTKEDVAELAGLSSGAIRKAATRANSENVAAPAVDEPSDRLFGELVRQVVLLQRQLETLESQIE